MTPANASRSPDFSVPLSLRPEESRELGDSCTGDVQLKSLGNVPQYTIPFPSPLLSQPDPRELEQVQGHVGRSLKGIRVGGDWVGWDSGQGYIVG